MTSAIRPVRSVHDENCGVFGREEPPCTNPIGRDGEQVETYVVSDRNSKNSRLKVNPNRMLAAEAVRE